MDASVDVREVIEKSRERTMSTEPWLDSEPGSPALANKLSYSWSYFGVHRLVSFTNKGLQSGLRIPSRIGLRGPNLRKRSMIDLSIPGLVCQHASDDEQIESRDMTH